MNTLVFNFIYRFMYILKAAANGWIVKSLGNNVYEFSYPI